MIHKKKKNDKNTNPKPKQNANKGYDRKHLIPEIELACIHYMSV